ncbi:helix-turn-helix domain-containing protein [Streptomyces spiramenti]|uniref:TetR/AcrR family transcriptional regulator n=1 Tax=Streptomyces spiramenti TaxID=2720606 RepID=UPI00308455B7
MAPRGEEQPPRLRADAARNRARVLRAAREQLAAGDDSLQLNTIARLAGVGVGTVYRHFPDRQALVAALSVERFQELAEAVRAAVAEGGAAMAVLHRVARLALSFMLEDSRLAAVLESGDGDPQVAESTAEVDAVLGALLDQARRDGAVKDTVTAADLRLLLCGVAAAVRAGGPDRAEPYLAVLLDGLRPVS